MCCRRHLKKNSTTKQNKIKQMNCTSTAKGCSLVPRESVAENKLATDAKTKTPPLGNLMIHKIKKRLRHQRLLIIYRSHQVVIIVCLPQSLVSYASGRRQTVVKRHKYIVTLEKSLPLCKAGTTPNKHCGGFHQLLFILQCCSSKPSCLSI